MTPTAFRDWRLRNDLTQAGAGELLGYSERWIRAWESGFEAPGKPAIIPKAVCLACWAIENGIEDWDGHLE